MRKTRNIVQSTHLLFNHRQAQLPFIQRHICIERMRWTMAVKSLSLSRVFNLCHELVMDELRSFSFLLHVCTDVHAKIKIKEILWLSKKQINNSEIGWVKLRQPMNHTSLLSNYCWCLMKFFYFSYHVEIIHRHFRVTVAFRQLIHIHRQKGFTYGRSTII